MLFVCLFVAQESSTPLPSQVGKSSSSSLFACFWLCALRWMICSGFCLYRRNLCVCVCL